MPYNTTWKDGKSVEKHQANIMPPLDPLKRPMNHMIDDVMWCFACDIPHSPSQCIVAKKLQEEEENYEEYVDDQTINMLSFEEYNSSREEDEYDVNTR